VTDSAAKPSASPLRARNGAARLVQYVLLQAVIAALCILVLHHKLPEPPARTQVTSFSLFDRGETRQVALPAFVPSRSSMNDPAVFTGSFDWSARDQGRAWSVYLPRFTNGIVVHVNGVEILDSRRDPAANRPDRATPEIAIIPATVLRDGANELVIELLVWGPISGFLDRVHVGPDADLRGYYEQRTLWFVTLPIVFAAWQAILAVILIVMCAMRRGEASYGALAAAMALGTCQAFFVERDRPARPSRTQRHAARRSSARKRLRAHFRHPVFRPQMAAPARAADLPARRDPGPDRPVRRSLRDPEILRRRRPADAVRAPWCCSR